VRVIHLKPDRPYLDAWLRRTGRQFAVSGRLSQIALLLARDEGGTPEEWTGRLRSVLDGGTVPSLDLLTKIDALLAPPGSESGGKSSQGTLF
jgi:hypothetical protein